MSRSPLLLLNCVRCDDIVRLVEAYRTCACGRTGGRISLTGAVVDSLVTARVLEIDWESYDGVAEGDPRNFTVLPRVQYVRTPRL